MPKRLPQPLPGDIYRISPPDAVLRLPEETDEQHYIQDGHYGPDPVEQVFGEPRVPVFAHHTLRRGQVYLQEDREGSWMLSIIWE